MQRAEPLLLLAAPVRRFSAKESPVATNKVIYATDVKIGSERARCGDVAPGAVTP
jgi:hypothetical protein